MGRREAAAGIRVLAQGQLQQDEEKRVFRQKVEAALAEKAIDRMFQPTPEQNAARIKANMEAMQGIFPGQQGQGGGLMGGGLQVQGLSINPQTGEMGDIKFENPLGLSRQRQNFLDTSRLRDEFINRPEVKEYVNINTQVGSMDALLNSAKQGNIQNKVALDQGLITMFNKLTDPNSVVRESEYARTPQNLPLANRFTGALQKLQSGGAGLTDSDREALVWGAKVIANERGRTYNSALDRYTSLGNRYGFDQELATGGLLPHQEYQVGGILGSGTIKPGTVIAFSSEEEAENSGLPIGTVVTINGRRAVIE